MNTPAEQIISRQAADIRSLKASTAALLEAKHKEMAEARLWFDKAQEAFAEITSLRERNDALALQADEWEGKYAFVSELLADLKARDAMSPATSEQLRDAIFEALGSELFGVYDCTRVWEAWSVGTMSQNDFLPVDNRLDEIVDTVMAVIPHHQEGGV